MIRLHLFTLALIFLVFSFNTNAQNLVTLDSSFGTNGFVSNISSSVDNGFFDAIVAPNQSIYAAGAIGSSNLQAIVAKYNSNGSLDLSYGNAGIGYVGNNTDMYFSSKLQLDLDGKAVACGYIADQNFGYQSMWVYRLNLNGTPDSSFGTNGIFQYDFGVGGYNSANDLKIQADGKIVVVGTLMDSTTFNTQGIVFRLNTNGTLDSSFGTNGASFIASALQANLYSCIIQTDGKIIVAGQDNSNSGDILVGRFNTNGTTDNTFGTNGITLIDDNSNYESASYLQLQTDGKIVYAGYSVDMIAFGQNIMLGRLKTDGTIDSSYNLIGYSKLDFKNVDNTLTKAKILSDNSLLITGTNANNVYNIYVSKIDSTGKIDSNFNFTGYKEIPLVDDANGFAVDIQSSGKIILAGYSQGSLAANTLCRLKETATGTPNLKLNTPNGGEQWATNSVQNITWTATNVTNVNLSYTTNGTTWTTIANNVTASTGSYAWTIPNTPSTNCWIKITDASNATILDSSDAKFSIVWPTSIYNPTLNKLAKVFPNPANDILKIELNKNSNSAINLTDIKGNIVYSKSATNNLEINTSNFANGIYNLNIVNNEGSQSQKIIIKH